MAAAQEADPALKAYIANLMGTATSETPAAQEGATQAEGAADTPTEATTTAAESTTANPNAFTEADDIQYTTTRVNMRSQPSTASDDTIIRSLDAGTWIHVAGDSAEWVYCNLRDGTVGYINKQFLTDIPPEG